MGMEKVFPHGHRPFFPACRSSTVSFLPHPGHFKAIAMIAPSFATVVLWSFADFKDRTGL